MFRRALTGHHNAAKPLFYLLNQNAIVEKPFLVNTDFFDLW